MNARMSELRSCFEAEGFRDVRTLLSSGNVVFDARASSAGALQRRAERAMRSRLDRSFETIVRSAESLQAFVASDPFAAFDIQPMEQRVVTFLRDAAELSVELPIERDGARILGCTGTEVLSVCEPGAKGSLLMSLVERAFGKRVTTRTLATVRRCAGA
jgi:uncharacterized protein (DUF1697 family)